MDNLTFLRSHHNKNQSKTCLASLLFQSYLNNHMCPIAREKGKLDVHFVNRTKTKTLLFLSSFTQNKLGEEPKIKSLEVKVSPSLSSNLVESFSHKQAAGTNGIAAACNERLFGKSGASLAVTSSHEHDQAGGNMAPPYSPRTHRRPRRKPHGCALTVPWARWAGSS